MHYEGTVIRPPSEAFSIILQVTVGCPYNRCTFCGAYKGVSFHLKEPGVLEADLDFASRHCTRLSRVFLADGDVMSLSYRRLAGLLKRIRVRLPWVRRISTYASARSLGNRSSEELRSLKRLGLDRIYMGLESGHDPTLASVRKGVDAETMVRSGRKVRAAGLFLSVTVLLGIAGEEDSLVHAMETGRVLTSMAPNQIAALTLMLLPGTPLHAEAASGNFRLPEPRGLLLELRTLIDHIRLERVQFQSNHASNYLTLSGRLPRDSAVMLAGIDQALEGKTNLLPEHQRHL